MSLPLLLRLASEGQRPCSPPYELIWPVRETQNRSTRSFQMTKVPCLSASPQPTTIFQLRGRSDGDLDLRELHSALLEPSHRHNLRVNVHVCLMKDCHVPDMPSSTDASTGSTRSLPRPPSWGCEHAPGGDPSIKIRRVHEWVFACHDSLKSTRPQDISESINVYVTGPAISKSVTSDTLSGPWDKVS